VTEPELPIGEEKAWRVRGMFDAIDDDEFLRASNRLELQAKLVLERGQQARPLLDR